MLAVILAAPAALAQERLPWQQQPGYGVEPPPSSRPAPYPVQDNRPPADPYSPDSRYTPPPSNYGAPPPASNRAPPRRDDAYRPPPRQHAAPYQAPRAPYDGGRGYEPPRRYAPPPTREEDRSYSRHEILDAGHKFFGSVSKGLADVVARLFRQAGRPNGFILGEDAGGAFVAGLRYGEGTLYTKYGRPQRVFWQGPTLGYDFGGEGSRTMTLVYNLRHPTELFRRFGGIQGSAYVVGGVGVQFLKHNEITLAPIRSGVGLRLGANIGYLKFTRRPTWNPF
ncbi:MAG: DUF1134 domain-containing protein [Hyphomicrobiaceae bacterium]|nr:DUF1134 domain-containing protein [Hyphomicrobiaceae bacterium]